MQCPNCGTDVNEEVRFCSSCGVEIGMTSDIENADEDQKWAKMVGKNYAYYKEKWSASHNPESAASWNWAAFAFGALWLGYRKMYKPIFILFGIFVLTDIIDIVSGFNELTGLLSYAVTGLSNILIGLYGNTLYYRHVQKKMDDLKYANADAYAYDKAGGTSGKGVAAVAVIMSVYFIFLLGLFAAFDPVGVTFGTSEGASGIEGVKEQFSPDEGIYYEVYFGERGSASTVEIHVLMIEDGTEYMVAQYEEMIDPNWEGFYNEFYDPDYGYLDPGQYLVRAYINGEFITEGGFEVKEIY